MPQNTLGPTVAGSWYPDDRETLAHEIDGMLSVAQQQDSSPGPAIRAVIAPHAGLVYSGTVAAAGFAGLRGATPHTVIVIGPSHYRAFEGAVVPESASYRTPLGRLPFPAASIRELGRKDGFQVDDEPFLPEHSVEIEFPFLQRILPRGFAVIPVLIGSGGGRNVLDQISRGLGEFTDQETLIVVSSDFTHYGRRFGYLPFRTEVSRRIRELDQGALDRILSLDGDGFADYVESTGATICGRRPIEVLLRMLPEDCAGRVAAYDTSGRITGDWNLSVSYASVTFGEPLARDCDEAVR